MGARGQLKLVDEEVAAVTLKGSMAEKLRGATHLEKPEGIRSNERMEEIWDWIVPKLVTAGLAHEMDSLTVELAVRHYVHAIDASDRLLKEDILIPGRDEDKRNPLETVFRNESMSFLQYVKQLGLSFGSRVRLQDVEAKREAEENPYS